MPDIFGNGIVKLPLRLMPGFPADIQRMGMPGQEKAFSAAIHRLPLFVTDHIRLDAGFCQQTLSFKFLRVQN